MIVRVLGTLLSPRGRRARLSVLIYHRVRPQSDAMRPDEIDADTFEWQMRLLAEEFHVLPLIEAVERLRTGSLPPRAVCITFDDGYLDNSEVALPILRGNGLTATFFIASGFLHGNPMWNDIVIESVRAAEGLSLDLHRLGLGICDISSMAARRQLATELIGKAKYQPAELRAEFVSTVHASCSAPKLPHLMMSEVEVRGLHAAGMSIGAHTRNHPILARLDEAAARQEIHAGREDLFDMIHAPIDLFAYPNGKPGEDYHHAHVRMISDAGFTAAVTTAWGSASIASDRFQLPRFTPWDMSRRRFAFRLLHNMTRPREMCV